MKPDIGILGAAAVIIGPAISGPEFGCVDALCSVANIRPYGSLAADNRRKLEKGASGVEGKVLVGNLGNTTAELFVATNATKFPKGSLNGTLRVAIPGSVDCTTEAYGRASKFPLKVPVKFIVNNLGRIGKDGWLKKCISAIQDANTALPVSLADLISGVESEYGLAVYLLSSEEELLACAGPFKVLDEDMTAEYDELLFGSSEEEVVKADTTSSASSKSGVFVFASAIAAVGIAVVLGEVIAL